MSMSSWLPPHYLQK
jgi:hypothetical protein